ncbi:MAG TPA: HAD family phosphatase [Candidatus Nanopelagicales bacterium]|nr:HAD family phosphatase [Candidatus Nanopelagicales bacterium]
MSAEPLATAALPAAVLFDMDGLLVETEHLWYQAELGVIDELGGHWTPEHQEVLVGGPLEKAVELLIDAAGGGHDPDDVMTLLLDRMEALLRTEPVHWRPGAPQLLSALEVAGVPRALVSASWRRLVDAVHDAVLHELGHELFDVTVAGDDIERTKPYPDPYLHAAARIGVDPRHCVVLEDSHTGSRAGLASGAFVVAVPSLVPIEPEPGLVVVTSLEEVTPELLGSWSHAWSPR